MTRRPIPPMAWVLSGAVAAALTILAISAVSRSGQNAFYGNQSDALFFRLTARHPFGATEGFAALHQITEAPYRYGRIGFPFLAWIFALGRPAWVGWTLIGVYIASIAAIPGIAAVLLEDLGAPPVAAATTLLVPGVLLNFAHVYSDPLLICLLLLACVLEGRDRRTRAIVVLGAAIFVKEIAVFALIPWIWSAIARRDWRGAATTAGAVVPYLAWCAFVRLRLGTVPFLAHTYSRRGALSAPFVGLRAAIQAHTPNIGVVTGAVVITLALGAIASWVARGTRLGALALIYTVLTACLGKNAEAYLLENARVIAVAQVFSILCVIVAISRWWPRRGRSEKVPADRREKSGLFVENASL
jgi:hypothetical protein